MVQTMEACELQMEYKLKNKEEVLKQVEELLCNLNEHLVSKITVEQVPDFKTTEEKLAWIEGRAFERGLLRHAIKGETS